MNEFDDIDRELEAAFTQRPTALLRPSLRDVKRRARRHQRQRSAGLVGACAIVGVGSVAVLATRSPSAGTTAGGVEGDATTTYPGTTICYPPDTYPATTIEITDTTVPLNNTLADTTTSNYNPASEPTTYSTVEVTTLVPYTEQNTYTLVAGDYPGLVAQKFDVSVADLDAANRDVPGYGGFIVGTVINIPFQSVDQTTTTMYGDPNYPCGQPSGYNFRCSGEPTLGDDGWWYFPYCEPIYYDYEVGDTTTSLPEPTVTATTCIVPPQMTLPSPATTTSVPGSC